MSLTDKVIKNTLYYIISQIAGFIFPLFLTPFIISKIGTEEFGIYAIVLGFTGTIGLFDLSVSSSFIKFISEYYNKKDSKSLNEVINTGLIFYLVFSLAFCIIAYLFTEHLLSLINIPPALHSISVFAFRISLVIFFITTSFGIFNSILISLQKMYLTSIFGTLISVLNFAAIIILLSFGYRLSGLLYSQLIAVTLSIILTYVVAKRELGIMHLSYKYFSKIALKKMTGFGLQMQVSKLASFASDKYDEFLLGFFSVLSNVTFFNVGARIARIGRFVPYQLIPQVAPLAAEFNAKGDAENLKRLFRDTTKYLNIVSFPIFMYILFFADVIIMAWMGAGFEMSAYLLRILAAAQLINMTFSAPGNSITPNIGIPKYQMYEGLINLGLNLVLSYFFIKYYGIIGAAIGNSISIALSSLYVFYVSSSHFKERISFLFNDYYRKPLFSSLIICMILFLISFFTERNLFIVTDRLSALVYLIPTMIIFSLIYSLLIFNGTYLNAHDRVIFIKILMKLLPVKWFINRRRNKSLIKSEQEKYYNNELVSLFIITYNRLDMLKKCVDALIPTLKDVNCEIIIWDNNSADGTKEFLSGIDGSKVKVILHDKNIGTNAKGKAAEFCKGAYLFGIDDDVIDFPGHWIQDMIYAYKNIPYIGYLAANVVQDEFTNGARPGDEYYSSELYDNGKIEFLNGPTGGWCFLISRKIYNKVGKFADIKERIFFSEDGDYLNRLINKGFRYGINKNVKVYHATGMNYNQNFKDVFDTKMKDYTDNKVPLLYHYKIKFERMFSLRRLYYKLLQTAEKEMNSVE